jgi:hypothetical protein
VRHCGAAELAGPVVVLPHRRSTRIAAQLAADAGAIFGGGVLLALQDT